MVTRKSFVVAGVVAFALSFSACGGSTAAVDANGSSADTAAPLPSSASPEELTRVVRALSETYVPRDHSHPENLDMAAAYIRAEFEKHGLTVAEQTYDVAGKTYRNLTARMGPSGGQRIIVGAHYDAYGNFPGADDNASGVSMMLEVARLLALDTLTTEIEFVAFTLEEPPQFRTPDMGSAVHAASVEPTEIKVMLSLEMVGYYSDTPGSQTYPSSAIIPEGYLESQFGNVGNFLAVIGRPADQSFLTSIDNAMSAASPLVINSLPVPTSVTGVDFSDHLNYWARGISAVMLTDTAFYRNEAYHTAGDTWDRLDYARMANATDALRAALKTL